MLPARNRVRRVESGVAAVEMALMTPILLLVLLGTIDFGRNMYSALAVSQAAGAGAAYGAQSNGTTSDYSGMEAAATAAGRDLGSGISATATRYCKCPGNIVVDCITGNCASGYGAPQVYVQVVATATFQTLFTYPGIPSTIPISRTAIKRAQ